MIGKDGFFVSLTGEGTLKVRKGISESKCLRIIQFKGCKSNSRSSKIPDREPLADSDRLYLAALS